MNERKREKKDKKRERERDKVRKPFFHTRMPNKRSQKTALAKRTFGRERRE